MAVEVRQPDLLHRLGKKERAKVRASRRAGKMNNRGCLDEGDNTDGKQTLRGCDQKKNINKGECGIIEVSEVI